MAGERDTLWTALLEAALPMPTAEGVRIEGSVVSPLSSRFMDEGDNDDLPMPPSPTVPDAEPEDEWLMLAVPSTSTRTFFPCCSVQAPYYSPQSPSHAEKVFNAFECTLTLQKRTPTTTTRSTRSQSPAE